MFKKLFSMMALMLALTACGASGSADKNGADSLVNNDSTNQTAKTMANTDNKYVEIKTSLGDITVMLYGDTPAHQANFLKLVKEGYYNNVLFHRVINEFMVQTGDPDSRDAQPGQMLGSGGPGYEIAAEIVYPQHFHKRGALAAARSGDQVNPERRSSGSQFYIVTGRKLSEAEMQSVEQQYAFGEKQEEFNRLANENIDKIRALQQAGDRAGLDSLQNQLIAQVEKKFEGKPARKIPAEIRNAYLNQGGTPHLDNAYTVFGEVIKGMDVVDSIQKVQTNAQDRPDEDIRILSMKEISAPKN